MFDRVWHGVVLYKLKEVGLLPDCNVRLIVRSFLLGRTFHEQILEILSSERRITAGVPRNTVLGPVMFSTFVNDMLRVIGVRLSLLAGNDGIDDLHHRIERRLCGCQPASTRRCLGWLGHSWRVAVNVSKSTAVVFTRRRKRPRPLTIGNTELHWTNRVNYLGFHLIWRAHIQLIRQHTSAQLSRPVLSSSATIRWLE